MAKSVDQRTKEMNEDRIFNFVNNWDSDTGKFKKELDAPNFRSQGNMVALCASFDKAQSTFEQNMQRKEDAKKFFDAGQAQLEKGRAQQDSFKKDLDDIVADAAKSRNTVDDADKVEDILKNWEETLKAQQDLNKERKSIFDNWIKADANHLKVITDTIDKVKKEINAAKSVLESTNAQLNGLESQIRALVTKYDNTARSMNRPEIGAAVRGFLHVFGK